MAIFVKIPMYMGAWEPASLWELVETSDVNTINDYRSGTTLNDAGEIVPLPFLTIEFESVNDAKKFIRDHE